MKKMVWFAGMVSVSFLAGCETAPVPENNEGAIKDGVTSSITSPNQPVSSIYSEAYGFPAVLRYETLGMPGFSRTLITMDKTGIMKVDKGMSFIINKETGESLDPIKTRTISLDQWHAFLKQISYLEVEKWERHYEDRTMLDGYTWSLRFETEFMGVQSGGRNAGPHPNNPNKTHRIRNRGPSGNYLFQKALMELWDSAEIIEPPLTPNKGKRKKG